jgi:hypothetical protein
MAALLYRTETIDRLWALLEAHDPFVALVKQSRRVTDTAEGWLKRSVLRSVGDFPHVTVDMGDNFGGDGVPFSSFASEVSGFGSESTDEYLGRCTADFKLSVVYERPGFDRQDALEMEMLAAVRSGGRDLGLGYVRQWGPWRGRRNGSTVALNADRPVTQIVVPVTYDFPGGDLLPD